jgi:outer membrane receptor protein involved in Fe transport
VEDHATSNFNPFSISSGAVFIPANLPSNPFNQDLWVSLPVNINAPATTTTTTNSLALGGTLKLPHDWLAHLDYQWSTSKFSAIYTSVLSYDATNDTGPTFDTSSNYSFSVPDSNPPPLWTGAINPLVDNLANPINWGPYSQSQHFSSTTHSNDLILAATGPLFHFPWGDPRLAIRLEHNKTGQPDGGIFSDEAVGTPYPGLPLALESYHSYWQGQATDSANAEVDFPIFKTHLPLLRSLDLQLNVSYSRTTVTTGTPGYEVLPPYPYNTNAFYGQPTGVPLILGPNTAGNAPSASAQPVRSKAVNSNTGVTGPALSYKPTDNIVIRASVASGYVPPTYIQLLPTNYLNTPSSTRITDPTTGTKYIVTYYDLGGNPDLKPQTSKSWNFGAIWEPQVGPLHGLRLDAEFTETKQYNLILNPGAQTLVNFESDFPSLVVRDPTSGRITTVYNHYINEADAKQDAWTFSADYTKRTSIGTFELNGAETIQEHVQRQLVVGSNLLEFVGFPNSGGVAKAKATSTLRWAFHNWVAAWTVVYSSSYKQYGAPGDPGAYATQLEKGLPYTLNTLYTRPQGGDTIPSQAYHNLYLSYTFRRSDKNSGSPWKHWVNLFLDDVKVSVVVNNVFNTLPPFDAYYQPFYTSPYGDVQLRNYSIALKKSF